MVLFVKVLTKIYGGKKHYYASLVENKRIDGKVVQMVKINFGAVEQEQIPYLKAAYSPHKPQGLKGPNAHDAISPD